MSDALPVLTGALSVSKPSGPTSYDIIRWVKRIARDAKIGHCGTLDPLASGVLILLFGKATRSQASFMGREKIYRTVIRLGLKTDSGDTDGRPLDERPVPVLHEEDVRAVLAGFVGEQEQIPPMYSAIKKDGVPLYKLARKGEQIERAPRRIIIHEIALLRLSHGELEFRTRCSSGTYVRTLAEDIAARLGTVGAVSTLVREAVGGCRVEDAVPGEKVKAWSRDELAANLRPVETMS